MEIVLDLSVMEIEEMQSQCSCSKKLLGTVVVGLLVATTNLSLSQAIQEEVKYIPGVGAAPSDFGGSVAMSDGIVVIGAKDLDLGSEGVVYLFDQATGNQLAILSSGGEYEYFGDSVDISDGVVAVGAPNGDGAVYLFDASTGTQLFKLIATDGGSGDFFGSSISIDGGVVAVGAHGNDFFGTDDYSAGAVYLFDVATGVQLFKLTPSDGVLGDAFGTSVAIHDGLIAVGAEFAGMGAGAAYIFDAATGAELTKLLPNDSAPDNYFGHSIDIEFGSVVVGQVAFPDQGNPYGAAYVFDALTGIQQSKYTLANDHGYEWYSGRVAIHEGMVAVSARGGDGLIAETGVVYLYNQSTESLIAEVFASDGDPLDWFGESIAMGSGKLLVGASIEPGSFAEPGSAYLMDLYAVGAQLSQVVPDTGNSESPSNRSIYFGSSVDIADGVVVSGGYFSQRDILGVSTSTGAAYLFDAVTGDQLAELNPGDLEAFDSFGYAVGVDSGRAAVSSRYDDNENGINSGSVYVFDVATGSDLYRVLPSDGAAGDQFGGSVYMSNGIIAVGAAYADNGSPDSGAAYLFDATTGVQLLKLLPDDVMTVDRFGIEIVLGDGYVAVGAPWDDGVGEDSGSVYIFDQATGIQLYKVVASDGAAGDRFGSKLSISNGILAVSAPSDDYDTSTNAGSVYLEDLATGTELMKITPSDRSSSLSFGDSLHIQGNTLVVGSSNDNDNGVRSGSVYIFNVETGLRMAKYLPSDGSEGDRFGYSVACDSDRVVVGAFQSDRNGLVDHGSVYTFSLPGLGLERAKLTASDGAAADKFGYTIAIDNDVVAVGAWGDDDNGDISGSAYLFDASTGGQIAKLLPSDGSANEYFGDTIDIDNGVVGVGKFADDANGTDSGSAYLFDASTGMQIVKLIPSDVSAGDHFGNSIAIANGVVAIGASHDDDNGSSSGSAYLFDASTGVQIVKLLPNDGAAGDFFGDSIAIANGIVAVGARLDDDNGDKSGSAYLFDASTGVQIAKLLPSDGAADDWFSSSIAIANGIVAVGAHFDDDNGTDSGSAYLFDASSGVQIAKLLPDDGSAGDRFGISISIANGVVAVGAILDNDNGTNSGSAYLFDAFTGVQIAKLLPSDGAVESQFGRSIAIANGIVAVGAYQHIGGYNIGSGAAYVFDTGTGTTCPADLTGDGVLNFFDVSAFLGAFAASDPAADMNGDGVFNFFDVSTFLAAFGQGCP